MTKRFAAAKAFIDDRRGQTALMFLLLLLAFFMLFALALDAGFWYFDHRWAQNQAEAAALAGAYRLPAPSPNAAWDAARNWLVQNGWGSVQFQQTAGECNLNPGPFTGDAALIEVMDCRPAGQGDDLYDTVRIRARRPSLVFLSALFNISFARVSASATAQVGSAGSINQVMPWALIQTDNDCDTGIAPLQPGESDCYGVKPGYVYRLVCSQQYAEYCRGQNGGSGNTAKLTGCDEDNRGQNEYEDCVRGTARATGFIVVDETTVYVDPLPGDRSRGTIRALEDRLRPFEGGNWSDCDVVAKPAPPSNYGQDQDGWQLAQEITQKISNTQSDPEDKCRGRLVVLPIITPPFASGRSQESQVAGFVTVYIAGWDRQSNDGKGGWGNSSTACSGSVQPDQKKKNDEQNYFYCGVVWGYVVGPGYTPAYAGGLADVDTSFAPMVVVLID